ncbi:hypothetical protein ACWGRF_01990 [Streptomyces zhihengii]
MARNINARTGDVHRAVINFTSSTGQTWTEYEGPYAKPGAARARLTFWANHMAKSGGTATGYVEQAETTWRRLDPSAAPGPSAAKARQHLAKGTNAEDCPACRGTNPPYPFLCPGPNEEPSR